jgi:oligopeptide/dipeptide ABC transporter ATP-binding protein
MTGALLSVSGLRAEYESRGGFLRRRRATPILDDFSLEVFERETLGLVGESGSGKTTLILTVLGLLKSAAGEIRLGGVRLTSGRNSLRREIQVVFQNPFSSLDPHLTVLEVISEPLVVHKVAKRHERDAIVTQLLDDVGLSREFLSAYPHELSGGQAQRVALARALALRPKLLLLDEPTSSLDVSVQAQVLNLLLELQQKFGLTYLFVSHDLGVVQHISDRIAVMYLGQIVEVGATDAIFRAPAHPYTQALLAASGHGGSRVANVLSGAMPKFTDPPAGCRFHTRCPFVMDVCRHVPPPAFTVAPGWEAACHLLDDAESHGNEQAIAGVDSVRDAVHE